MADKKAKILRRQIEIVLFSAAIASQATAEPHDAGSPELGTENDAESRPGCDPIIPDNQGKFQVEGSCAFFPVWEPGACVDMYDASILGHLNSALLTLTKGKARLLPPLDGSEMPLRIEGADDLFYEVLTKGEAHIFLNEDLSEVTVVSVRGNTTVRRPYDGPYTLKEGEGRSFSLLQADLGCSVNSDSNSKPDWKGDTTILIFILLAFAGRRLAGRQARPPRKERSS